MRQGFSIVPHQHPVGSFDLEFQQTLGGLIGSSITRKPVPDTRSAARYITSQSGFITVTPSKKCSSELLTKILHFLVQYQSKKSMFLFATGVTREALRLVDEKELKHRLLLDAFLRSDAPAELAEYWILSGALLQQKHPESRTSLQWAIHRNWSSVVQLLLQRDLSSDCTNFLLLHQAVRDQADDELFRILLLKCPAAGINVKDEHGQTALHVAASMNRPDIVQLLIQSRAKFESEDRLGFRPLHSAASSTNRIGTGTTRVAALLINRVSFLFFSLLESPIYILICSGGGFSSSNGHWHDSASLGRHFGPGGRR